MLENAIKELWTSVGKVSTECERLKYKTRFISAVLFRSRSYECLKYGMFHTSAGRYSSWWLLTVPSGGPRSQSPVSLVAMANEADHK